MKVTYILKPRTSVDSVNQAWYAVRQEPAHDLTFQVTEAARGGETPLDGTFCYHRLEDLYVFLTLPKNPFASVEGLDALRFAIKRGDIRKPNRGGCFHCQIEYMRALRDASLARKAA